MKKIKPDFNNRVRTGRNFQVALPANVGHGFNWEFDIASGNAEIVRVETRAVPNSSYSMRVAIVRAQEPGEIEIVSRKTHVWEPMTETRSFRATAVGKPKAPKGG